MLDLHLNVSSASDKGSQHIGGPPAALGKVKMRFSAQMVAGGRRGFRDGGGQAMFDAPSGVALDGGGSQAGLGALLVCDSNNGVLRSVSVAEGSAASHAQWVVRTLGG